jgi:hypothetical protein
VLPVAGQHVQRDVDVLTEHGQFQEPVPLTGAQPGQAHLDGRCDRTVTAVRVGHVQGGDSVGRQLIADVRQRLGGVGAVGGVGAGSTADQTQQHRPPPRRGQQLVHQGVGHAGEPGGQQLTALASGHRVHLDARRTGRQDTVLAGGHQPHHVWGADEERFQLGAGPDVVDDQQHPPPTQHPPEVGAGQQRVGVQGLVPGHGGAHVVDPVGQVRAGSVLPEGHPHHPVAECLPGPDVVDQHPGQSGLPEPARTRQPRRHAHHARPGDSEPFQQL